MPIIPGLTDSEKDLDALMCGARDANAQWFGANVLYLMPESRKTFMAFLQEKFPRLVDRYTEWYGRGMNAPESYRQQIKERVGKLRVKYQLGSIPSRPGTDRSSAFTADAARTRSRRTAMPKVMPKGRAVRTTRAARDRAAERVREAGSRKTQGCPGREQLSVFARPA